MRRAVTVGVLVFASVALAQEAGGLTWKAPAKWNLEPARPMRAATYSIPAAKGDTEGAELGVFYFGEGQGGSVDANLQRWYGQFQPVDGKPPAQLAKTHKETINGVSVTQVELTGTYLQSPPGMMGGQQTPRPGFRLVGAIAQGPSGPVFFKMVGPQKTVSAAEADFKKLLKSLKKGGAAAL